MKIDLVITKKETGVDDYIHLKTSLSLCGDEEGLKALRDMIDLKLKLKQQISCTLTLSSDHTHNTNLKINLIGE